MKLKKAYLFLVFILILAGNIHAQLTGTKLVRDIQDNNSPGKITIVQDEEIVTLLDKHLYEESKHKGIEGYRIKLFSNSGRHARKEGEMVKANFISRYPNIRTSFLFNTPFFELYIGDFRTHSEAMKFLKEIERYYPNAFIVGTKIKYPSL